MGKVLLLVLIGFIAYALFRGFSRSQVRKDEAAPRERAATSARR